MFSTSTKLLNKSFSLSIDDEENEGCSLLAYTFFSIFIVLIWQWLWPSVIPFTTFEFWNFSTVSIVNASWAMIPLFSYGLILTSISLINNKEVSTKTKNDMFVDGTILSIYAGLIEEILFRWLFFYSAIVGISIVDWILGGFIFDFGLMGVLYNYILIPIANVLTFGYMEPYIYPATGWIVGAAVVSSNGLFRNCHAHQGFWGWASSWFCGMILFYIMFTSGLVAAIVVHFIYDFLIFTLIALVKGK